MQNLEERVSAVIHRLGFPPSRSFVSQVPYWENLAQAAEKQYGSWSAYLEKIGASSLIAQMDVPIPSHEQKMTGVSIFSQRKTMVLDDPGTRKTVASLSALVPIKHYENNSQFKTVVVSPGYVIPNWLREIEQVIPQANPVVITKDNRQRALKRAAQEETDLVLISTDMIYQRSSMRSDPDFRRAVAERLLSLPFNSRYATSEKALSRLEELLGEQSIISWQREVGKKRKGWRDLLQRIAEEEIKEEIDPLNQVLEEQVLNGSSYYLIVDEFHNIVDFTGKRAKALARLARASKYTALLSGTAIASEVEGLAFAAYALGFVEDPTDFRRMLRKDLRIARAFIDMHAIHPIRRLSEIDPHIPQPNEVRHEYSLTPEESFVESELLNSEDLDGGGKYYLLGLFHLNPPALLAYASSDSGQELTKNLSTVFDENPTIRKKLQEIKNRAYLSLDERVLPSRLAALRSSLVASTARKIGVFTDYTTHVSSEIARVLDDLGVVTITQDDSSSPCEIRLTFEEERKLSALAQTRGIILDYEPQYRSELTREIRELLGISWNEVFGLSQREAKLLEAVTDPDIQIINTTFGTLREGLNARELDEIHFFGKPTVPAHEKQVLSRTVRSGQRKIISIVSYNVAGELSLDAVKEDLRARRQEIIDALLYDSNVGEQALAAHLAMTKKPEEYLPIRRLLNQSSHSIVSLIFSRLQGGGTEAFVRSMECANNAYLLALHYNRKWDVGLSANNGRLCRSLTLSLEEKLREQRGADFRFSQGLDLACGPLVMARMLPQLNVTAVDVNRYQIEFGLLEKECSNATTYLGSVTNLKCLVPLSSTSDVVFNPQTFYSTAVALPHKIYDIAWLNFALYFLDRKGALEMFSHLDEVLTDGAPLIITMPAHKVAEACLPQLYKDIFSMGYDLDEELTGTYLSDNFAVEKPSLSPAKFEVFTLVAYKNRSPSSLDAKFELKPPYKIKVGGREKGNCEPEDSPGVSGIICRSFYKKGSSVIVTSPAVEDEFDGLKEIIDILGRMREN